MTAIKTGTDADDKDGIPGFVWVIVVLVIAAAAAAGVIWYKKKNEAATEVEKAETSEETEE